MRHLCLGCPVLADCAAYVEQAHPSAGWWAGTNRDPAYAEPARPGWVPVGTSRTDRARRAPSASSRSDLDLLQGLLPLPLTAAGPAPAAGSANAVGAVGGDAA